MFKKSLFDNISDLPAELQYKLREDMTLRDRSALRAVERRQRAQDPNFNRDVYRAMKRKINDLFKSIKSLDNAGEDLYYAVSYLNENVSYFALLGETLFLNLLKWSKVQGGDVQNTIAEWLADAVGSVVVEVVQEIDGYPEGAGVHRGAFKRFITVIHYVAMRNGGILVEDHLTTDLELLKQSLLVNWDDGDDEEVEEDSESPRHMVGLLDFSPLFTYEDMRAYISSIAQYNGGKKRRNSRSKSRKRTSRVNKS
jgi:hypothetical protein